MTSLAYIAAISEDWETYSPMSRDDVTQLIDLIAEYEGQLEFPAAPEIDIRQVQIEAWGVQAAMGNWDTPTALQAVHAFYARTPRAVWCGDGPEAGQLRPVLPGDITEFITAMRRHQERP